MRLLAATQRSFNKNYGGGGQQPWEFSVFFLFFGVFHHPDLVFFLGKNFLVKLGKTWDFCLFGWLSEA